MSGGYFIAASIGLHTIGNMSQCCIKLLQLDLCAGGCELPSYAPIPRIYEFHSRGLIPNAA